MMGFGGRENCDILTLCRDTNDIYFFLHLVETKRLHSFVQRSAERPSTISYKDLSASDKFQTKILKTQSEWVSERERER